MASSKRPRSSSEDIIGFSKIKDEEQLRAIYGGKLTIRYVRGHTPLDRESEARRVPHTLLRPWVLHLGPRLSLAHRQITKKNEYSLYPQLFILISHILDLLPNAEDFAVSVAQKYDLEEREEGEEGDDRDDKEGEETAAEKDAEREPEKEEVPQSKAQQIIIGLEEHLKQHNIRCHGYAEFAISERYTAQIATSSASLKNLVAPRIRRLVIEAKPSINNKNGLFQLMGELRVCAELNRELGCSDPVHGLVTDGYSWYLVRYDIHRDDYSVWEEFKALSSFGNMLIPAEGLRTLVVAFLFTLHGLPRDTDDLEERVRKIDATLKEVGQKFVSEFDDKFRLFEENEEKKVLLERERVEKEASQRLLIKMLKKQNLDREAALEVFSDSGQAAPDNFDKLWEEAHNNV